MRVDANPVRQHVRRLIDAGVQHKDIEQAAGISNNTIWRLLTNQFKSCSKETADAILALTVPAIEQQVREQDNRSKEELPMRGIIRCQICDRLIRDHRPIENCMERKPA